MALIIQFYPVMRCSGRFAWLYGYLFACARFWLSAACLCRFLRQEIRSQLPEHGPTASLYHATIVTTNFVGTHISRDSVFFKNPVTRFQPGFFNIGGVSKSLGLKFFWEKFIVKINDFAEYTDSPSSATNRSLVIPGLLFRTYSRILSILSIMPHLFPL